MMAKNNQAEVPMPPDDNVLEFRVSVLEGAVGEIKTAVKSIDTSLKTLTTLEVHHSQTRDAVGRAFSEIKRLEDGDIKDHEDRLRGIEADLPTMRLVRNWVITGVLGCTSLVGVAVAGMVIVSAKAPQPAIQQVAR